MKIASDPNDTLARLIRGAVYDSATHQVAKLQALSAVSRLGAAAYARAVAPRAPMARPKTRVGGTSVDDAPALFVRFQAADAITLVRAMIAAAAADGEIDALENRRILRYLRDAGGTPEEFEFARIAMAHPVTAEALADGVRSRELAVEIYAAALLATHAATPGGRSFLGRLALALGLDRAFLTELHASWQDPLPE